MGPPIYIGGNNVAGGAVSRRGGGLQWGHRFTSVETNPSGREGKMRRRSFNGATDLHRWKRSRSTAEWVSNLLASMGPPIYIGGNHCWLTLKPATSWLQWGHRFTSVETESKFCSFHVHRYASMGPPIYIGGNRADEVEKYGRMDRFNGATDLHRWKQGYHRSRYIGL